MSAEIQVTIQQPAVVKTWSRKIALSKFFVANIRDPKHQELGTME
jgi:hypothetical protein